MPNLKHFSSSSMDSGFDLLSVQNGVLDKSKDCDMVYLKLVCSDGYLMIHKILLPNYQTSTSSKPSEQLETYHLPNLNITQASKLLFLIYTGEVLISKSCHTAIKPILEAFQIFHVKRTPPSRGPTPTRTINTRSSSRAGGGIVTSGSTKEEITRRKIAGVKNLPCGGGEEKVFIFGDGTIMGIPTSTSPASPLSTNLVYNLNGEIFLDDSSEKDFHYCAPCSLIFCDRSDFLNHSSSSKCLNHNPPPPLTPTVKVIKLEPGFIKVEEQFHVDTVYFDDVNDPNKEPDHCNGASERKQLFGEEESTSPLNLCLICVHHCKNAVELIIHSKQKHMICSEKDYDYGSWTCKWCHLTCGSTELSAFLQHAYHCKKEIRMSQKKSASTSPQKNKRRKTQNPPPASPTPPPIPLTLQSLPTPRPPPQLTPEHIDPALPKLIPPSPQDNQTVSQPMEIEAPADPTPQSSSAPLKSPLVIKNTFRIPKLSKLTASTPSEKYTPISTDDPNCLTPLIPRLPIKISPQTSVSRRPKLQVIRNTKNRKLKFSEEEPPSFSNPPIMYKGVNITLTSGTSVSTTNGNTKPTTIKVNQPGGIKRKAEEIAVPTSSTKKQKKVPEPRIISPWTCRRCPTKTFATQREYMHHDCRQYNIKPN